MYTFLIPYNSIPAVRLYKQPVTTVYHSAMWEVGKQRIIRTLLSEFATISSHKRRFLHRLLYSSVVKAEAACQSAYLISFSVLGRSVATFRNLAHTLQDPTERQVYVVCLENAFQEWNDINSAFCWEFVGVTAVICIIMCALLFGPRAMLQFYDPPHH